MTDERAFVGLTVLLGAVAVVHAAVTWPTAAVLAFFGGGALVAFAAEVAAVRAGWLVHHVGTQVLGVPLYALAGWTGIVYVAFRLALLATDGATAVLLAGALATAYDGLTDHRGVDSGFWSYTDDLPGPRPRGVPWWNFLGWSVVGTATAALALPFV